MNREDFLELSNSKSLVDSQSTALYSAAKFGSVDKLVEDQDSMTFSDILRGDIFKTPQKSCYQLFPFPKGSPPTKSEVKESLNEQLGKRSDFEKKFLDSHLDQYLSRVCVKRSKRIQNKVSPRGSIDTEPCHFKTIGHQEPQTKDHSSQSMGTFSCSTKLEVSRQKPAKDMPLNAAVDHKGLFERIGSGFCLSQEQMGKPFSSRLLFQPRFTEILDDDQDNGERTLGVSGILSLCQNISSEALAIIQSIREVRDRAVNFSLPVLDTNEPSIKNDSSPSEELLASSESLSLKNFPSSTRRCSATLHHPEDLPESLFSLYNKFSRLDFIVQETSKMGRLSLWESQVSHLLKISNM